MHRPGASLFLFTPSNVGIDVADSGAQMADDDDFDDREDREV